MICLEKMSSGYPRKLTSRYSNLKIQVSTKLGIRISKIVSTAANGKYFLISYLNPFGPEASGLLF